MFKKQKIGIWHKKKYEKTITCQKVIKKYDLKNIDILMKIVSML